MFFYACSLKVSVFFDDFNWRHLFYTSPFTVGYREFILEQVISVHTGVGRNFLNVNFIGTLFRLIMRI